MAKIMASVQIEHFYLGCLAHASYLVESNGVAAVIDPQRDVGRPDLSRDHTPQELAAMLYRSLHDKLLKLPDETEIFPAHGAGSLCGRQMGSERSSTIGNERRFNYALQARSCDEFVRLLT